jgi:ADP-heptose:LPS heptosyltransferase
LYNCADVTIDWNFAGFACILFDENHEISDLLSISRDFVTVAKEVREYYRLRNYTRGVTIDFKLDFNTHISNICIKKKRKKRKKRKRKKEAARQLSVLKTGLVHI